jgi:hypothetical protein
MIFRLPEMAVPEPATSRRNQQPDVRTGLAAALFVGQIYPEDAGLIKPDVMVFSFTLQHCCRQR